MSDLLDRIANVLTLEERVRLARQPSPTLVPIPPIPIGTNPRLLAKGLRHEYATFYPGDVKHRGILLQHTGGAFGLHKADTGELDQMLPAQINHSSQPRWRRTEPDKLIFRYLNELREFDAGSGAITTIRKFEWADINNGIGESDISEDDRHIALYAGTQLFVYDFIADKIEWSGYIAAASFNNFYITSDNQVIVGHYKPGHTLYRKDGSTLLLATGLGHMDTSSDKNGNPIMVWNNSADDSGENRNAKLPNCKNGVVLIDVNSGKQTCLARFTTGWPAMHISLPDKAEFTLVSIFDAEKSSIYKILLDGSAPGTILATGKGAASYDTQPHASVSHDGTRYVYQGGGDTWIGTI